MSSNIVNQVAYLRTSRNFPTEINDLTLEISKSYIDIANTVNSRTIGIFPNRVAAVTGEAWFLTNNQRQQGLRQAYSFTTTANIDLGFKIREVSRFTRFYGAYTDGTNWYGLIGGSNVAIAGQISFYVLSTANPQTDQIAFLVGGGAPAVTLGQLVLEWISDP